jgi:hypothetical protein
MFAIATRGISLPDFHACPATQRLKCICLASAADPNGAGIYLAIRLSL